MRPLCLNTTRDEGRNVNDTTWRELLARVRDTLSRVQRDVTHYTITERRAVDMALHLLLCDYMTDVRLDAPLSDDVQRACDELRAQFVCSVCNS